MLIDLNSKIREIPQVSVKSVLTVFLLCTFSANGFVPTNRHSVYVNKRG